MISPELLNLQESSPWSKEFGLSEKDLKRLLFAPAMNFIDGTTVAGVFFHLFPDNSQPAVEFCIGEEFENYAPFRALAIKNNNTDDMVIFDHEHQASNNEKALNALNQIDIQSCWYIPLLQIDKRFLGFLVAYSKQDIAFGKTQASFVRMLRDAVITSLSLCKEKRLREDLSEIQSLVANTNQHPIFAKDTECRIVYANNAFMNMYPAEQQDKVLGYTTVESYDTEEANAFLADDREAFENGITKNVETLLFPDGQTRVLETTKKRFQTSSGAEYILGVSYDLTEKIGLIEKLKKRNAELDKFSNIALHDIRSPINSILKLASWSLDDFGELEGTELHAHLSDTELFDNVQQIRMRAERINQLLEDLFEYSHAGREKYDALTFGLRSLVMELLPLLEMPETTKLNIDDIDLLIPRAPFELIILNLLNNAIQHSEAAPLVFDINAEKLKAGYKFSFTDNGKGIDPNHHETVFQLFETLSPQFERAGSGKGLALVKKIVETYGGSITLRSAPNEGACFDVFWPI
jgi:signal transduction histidine kinase